MHLPEGMRNIEKVVDGSAKGEKEPQMRRNLEMLAEPR
jgi:hypothetical protein